MLVGGVILLVWRGIKTKVERVLVEINMYVYFSLPSIYYKYDS